MTTLVSGGELNRFIGDVFERAGLSRDHARTLGDSLTWANLRGVDTHGVVRVPRYVEMIEQGLMNRLPNIELRRPTSSSVVLNADRAAGPVVMLQAVDELLALVKDHGLALALVNRMTHSGALGYYTSKVAAAGMACIAFNSGTPLMPYHGTRVAALGTNPISIAIPGGEGDPLVFDMATSAVSLGKLILARKTNTPLEPGWAIDDAGNSTTDPKAAALTAPLGGPKGSGLAFMIECLAGLLGGNAIIADALLDKGESGAHRQNAMLIAIDVSRFLDLATFRAEVGRLVSAMKELPLAAGSESILMPGERGYRTMKKREQNGIPLPPPILSELTAIAAKLNVTPLAPLS
jgi:ureidoglycolate dehydrogenase (NAD+)